MAKLPRLAHVKYVQAKGKTYAYFNTGTVNDNGKPIYTKLPHPGAMGFFDSYAALVAGRTKRAVRAYTIKDLANDYEASKHFQTRAVNTQKLYRITINRIVELLGEHPVNDLRREELNMVLESEIKGVGAHNIFIAVLGILYRFGRRAGKTTLRPTDDIEKMATGEHQAWPEPLVEAGLLADHDRTRLAVHLLYFTGQRIGDVVKMRWSDVRDDCVHVIQQKTGKRLKIPLISELRNELAATPKRGLTIITNQHGNPMTDQVIRRELKLFGDDHGHKIVPHGLRKNAVISLLEAGCTVAETAAITGQTFNVVEYYARQIDQSRLGSAAIVKLENKRGTGKRPGKQARKSSVSAGVE